MKKKPEPHYTIPFHVRGRPNRLVPYETHNNEFKDHLFNKLKKIEGKIDKEGFYNYSDETLAKNMRNIDKFLDRYTEHDDIVMWRRPEYKDRISKLNYDKLDSVARQKAYANMFSDILNERGDKGRFIDVSTTPKTLAESMRILKKWGLFGKYVKPVEVALNWINSNSVVKTLDTIDHCYKPKNK